MIIKSAIHNIIKRNNLIEDVFFERFLYEVHLTPSPRLNVNLVPYFEKLKVDLPDLRLTEALGPLLEDE